LRSSRAGWFRLVDGLAQHLASRALLVSVGHDRNGAPREWIMDDTKAQTESLLDIVKGIDNRSIMLPEFQRDFRWEIEQTFDLFDSISKDIFIGTIIYGKPAFGMTLREIDKRPRRGENSRSKLSTKALTTDEIKQEGHTKNLRIVLDGQQRITSIYRALTGIGGDKVHLILNDFLSFDDLRTKTLETATKAFSGAADAKSVSVLLSDAYRAEIEMLEQDELDEQFNSSPYGRFLTDTDPSKLKDARRAYRWGIAKLRDLYKQQKLVAYYLLDMNLDKFCLFFERSNSRGILLNFTDILAAKLYSGFNLRKRIEEYESRNSFRLNREVIIRAIAYIRGTTEEKNGSGGHVVAIDKKDILERLEAKHFTAHWEDVCGYYNDVLHYLTGQQFVLSQDWIPSENLILPLMMFRRKIRGFDQMNEQQRRFVEFWFWASVFSNRYAGSSNETIIEDSGVLELIAKNEKIPARYCERMRSRVDTADDLFSYTKRASIIYRGVLNLLSYHNRGLRSWNNGDVLKADMPLEGHHIYPRAYVMQAYPNIKLDVPQAEAEELVDSVVNITLIPKLTNIRIGKKPPSAYLTELRISNPLLTQCLESHLVNPAIMNDSSWDKNFKQFLDERGAKMVALIRKYAVDPVDEMTKSYEPPREHATPV